MYLFDVVAFYDLIDKRPVYIEPYFSPRLFTVGIIEVVFPGGKDINVALFRGEGRFVCLT